MARTAEPITKIEVRGRTRYRVTVDTAEPGETRRQTRRTFDTRKAAVRFLAATRSQVDEGRYQADTALTFDTLADQWLAAKRLEVRPNTYKGYESGIRRARAVFGSKPVQRVTRSDVEAMVSNLVEGGCSKRTTEYTLGLVRQCFDRAEDEGSIQRNPARRVKPAGRPKAQPVAFDSDELRKIRKAIAGDWAEHGFLLTLHGLRRSEVLALQWSDIDLPAATLTVRHSRTEVRGAGTHTAEPKTERGRRTLPLGPEVVALLRRTRQTQQSTYGLQQARAGHLVIDELGRPMPPDRYSDLWRQVVAEAEVRPLDLLAARRSSVTVMRDSGVPDHHVAAWHGHDEAVMRRNYSVAMDEGLKAAGAALVTRL